MGNKMSELASYFQPLAQALVDKCNADFPRSIIDTGRTPEQQKLDLLHGVSWTENSKHLPQPPEMKSEAIDICPTAYLPMKLWNPTGPLWNRIGVIVESMGMRWGGRFPGIRRDPGHAEYIHPAQNPVDNLTKA